MDTLSRDSSSSGSVLPLVGVIAGALALVLSATALFKLSTVQKAVNAHEEAINTRIPAVEALVNEKAAKAENDVRVLREGVQKALTDVGTEFGSVNAKIAKLEESMKKPAPAAARPGVVTGTVDANGNYSVAPGDTLAKIARKFATRIDAIEAENPGLDPTKLKVGQKIRIPRK